MKKGQCPPPSQPPWLREEEGDVIGPTAKTSLLDCHVTDNIASWTPARRGIFPFLAVL